MTDSATLTQKECIDKHKFELKDLIYPTIVGVAVAILLGYITISNNIATNNQKIEDLNSKLSSYQSSTDSKLDKVESRLDSKIDKLDSKLDNITSILLQKK